MRRYVTDAGPLLERLHRLTRSDCTTRNLRKAARLSGGVRRPRGPDRARCASRRSSSSIRPDLDGTQIMEILGLAPGREVGEAYKYLLELRMERGPLGPDAARDELLTWWAARA